MTEYQGSNIKNHRQNSTPSLRVYLFFKLGDVVSKSLNVGFLPDPRPSSVFTISFAAATFVISCLNINVWASFVSVLCVAFLFERRGVLLPHCGLFVELPARRFV